MVPSLDVARAHVRVLELEADRLRHRHRNPSAFRRMRDALKARSN